MLKKLILILCIIGLIFCAYKIITKLLEYKAATTEYEKLNLDYTEDTKEKDDDKIPLKINWKKLKKINPDIVGWIYVDACKKVISYPIVQTDNNNYYLHRTFKRQYLYSGSIFLECKNKKDFSDQNSIIYGHNMMDGSMFASLKKLKNQKIVKKYPKFWILTPKENYRYKICSVATVGPRDKVYTIAHSTNEKFLKWQKYIHKISEVKADKEESITNKFATLSTCHSNNRDRVVVIGRLYKVL